MPDYPFQEFLPQRDGTRFFVPQLPQIQTQYSLQNPEDTINQHRRPLQKVLLTYVVGDGNHREAHEIFCVEEFAKTPLHTVKGEVSHTGMLALRSEICERLTRRRTKGILEYTNQALKIDEEFIRRAKGTINEPIKHGGKHILIMRLFPNMEILREKEDESDYDGIKELDGLFMCEYQGVRHIFVLETKVERLHERRLDKEVPKLINNLYLPLRQMYSPSTVLTHILAGRQKKLFDPHYKNAHILQETPQQFTEALGREGVYTLFFPIPETKSELNEIVRHLIQYYDPAPNGAQNGYSAVLSATDTIIYDKARRQVRNLAKISNDGLWREQPLVLRP